MAFDFSKAFDTVDHGKLIHLLQELNFSVGFVEWLCDYLLNRYQRVRYCGITSEFIRCTSGVPQGSKLGPLLFSLYTSQIKPASSETKYIKFSDDLNYALPIHKACSSLSIIEKIPIELNHLSSYASDLYLKLNDKKTKLLPIMKKGQYIHTAENSLPNKSCFSDYVTIFGVTFSCDLS